MSIQTKNPREAAYMALLSSLKDEAFIGDTLEKWRKEVSPSDVDYNFARQIAYGSSQMALALDYLSEQLSEKGKVSLKPKELALVRIALFQFYFLDRIPLYAIANESMKLATKHCHKVFGRFLNAILRKLEHNPPQLPTGDTPKEISIRFSYPIHFVEVLIAIHGIEQAKKLLAIGNQPASTMVRIRTNGVSMKGLEEINKTPAVAKVIDHSVIPTLSRSPSYYIQNITPVILIANMSQGIPSPNHILDLCASPGGKLLAIHDTFPYAHLYANDISQVKMRLLEENCSKYNLKAQLSCGEGRAFNNTMDFDLIILDVPCSNSGVFNKRPEARWRLTIEALADLQKKQLGLLSHAKSLLKPGGEIWYMTCSILPDENETIVSQASKNFGLKIRRQELILPNVHGWDGGFACALRRD